MVMTDIRGVPTSAENSSSLETYEMALEQALALRGNPIRTIDEALVADPGFVMGHCLRAQMQLLSMERSLLGEAARNVELAETFASGANERERGIAVYCLTHSEGPRRVRSGPRARMGTRWRGTRAPAP